jgi:hypothetical protein
VSGITVTGGSLVIDATAGPINAPLVFAGTAGDLAVKGAGATWTVDGGSGSVSGPVALSFSGVTSLHATGAGHTLVGPSGNATWTISGAGGGTVGGVAFTGFTNLTGAAGNNDTFVISGGTVPGTIDGGAGGFDSLVIAGAVLKIAASASGPSSGTVTVDGQPLHYTGLEPITITPASPTPPVSDVTIAGSASGDSITVKPDTATPGNVLAEAPSMESISFPVPTATLTISGGDGDDTVTFEGTLLLPGVTLLVEAEHIIVSSGARLDTTGGATDGSITFTAANTQTGS